MAMSQSGKIAPSLAEAALSLWPNFLPALLLFSGFVFWGWAMLRCGKVTHPEETPASCPGVTQLSTTTLGSCSRCPYDGGGLKGV